MSKKTISKMLFSNQERVELALVDDIETLFKDVTKQNDKIESLAKELRSVSIRTAVKIEQMRKMRTQVEAKAKELGVDPDTIIATGMFSRTNNIMKKIDLIKKLRGV
jgi:phage shock protein A